MPDEVKQGHMLGFTGFFIGEAGVTHTLGSIVIAAPTNEGQHYLATQLAGISRDALESLESAFWERIERDFEEYEQRFGGPHPLRDDRVRAVDIEGEA